MLDVNSKYRDSKYCLFCPHKTIIAGSRDITDYRLVFDAVLLSGFRISEVVSGRARGVDRLGERWAENHYTRIKPFPAKWSDLTVSNLRIKTNSAGLKYNALAGFNRNQEMVDYCDQAIFVWNGSPGTKDTIERCVSLKPCFILRIGTHNNEMSANYEMFANYDHETAQRI